MAPRSGRDTIKKMDKSFGKVNKDLRMSWNKLINRAGLICDKKLAELNKKTVTAYNNKRNNGSTKSNVGNTQTVEKMHENSAATKAVDSPTDKSHLRKVPVNVK